MKKLLLALLLISILTIAQQPLPLIEDKIKVQPILENETNPEEWYISTIKIYYKDTIGFKPIELRKGPPVTSRCSDVTNFTFISRKDTLSMKSLSRISCEIIAYVNLNSYERKWLKDHLVEKIIIFNTVTDNEYIIYINDTAYFKRLLEKYNERIN